MPQDGLDHIGRHFPFSHHRLESMVEIMGGCHPQFQHVIDIDFTQAGNALKSIFDEPGDGIGCVADLVGQVQFIGFTDGGRMSGRMGAAPFVALSPYWLSKSCWWAAKQSAPKQSSLGCFWFRGLRGQHGHHLLTEVRGEGAFNLNGIELLIDLRVTDRCQGVVTQVAHLVQSAHGRARDLYRLLLVLCGEGTSEGSQLWGEAATSGLQNAGEGASRNALQASHSLARTGESGFLHIKTHHRRKRSSSRWYYLAVCGWWWNFWM